MLRHHTNEDGTGSEHWGVGSSGLSVLVQVGSDPGDEARARLTAEQAEEMAAALLEKAAEVRAARARYEVLLAKDEPLDREEQYALMLFAAAEHGDGWRERVGERVPEVLADLVRDADRTEERRMEAASASLWQHLFSARPTAGTVGLRDGLLVVMLMEPFGGERAAEWEGFPVEWEEVGPVTTAIGSA